MKLTKISDIDNLPNGTYSNEITSNFTFTPNAKKVLIKELFALKLHTKQEYYSVAEIMKVIESYKATLNEPNVALLKPNELLLSILPVETEEVLTITKEVQDDSIINSLDNSITEELIELPKEDIIELLEEPKPLSIKKKRS